MDAQRPRVAVRLRPTTPDDIAFVTALERSPENRDLIGQWSDELHRAAVGRRGNREHWVVEMDGVRAGYLIAFDGAAACGGIYIKRVLVDRKNEGIGRAAVAAYLDLAFGRPGVDFVWLNVREWNTRAQAVYRALGFEPYEPDAEERSRIDAVAEPPSGRAFRLRRRRPA